jgi:sarcosine oxidase subunit alpha
MTASRVPGRGRVDHGKPVRFRVDGTRYTGLAGDTLASALLANGVHLMGRSFKYHRPRGVVSAGSDEPNALFGTRRGPSRFEPNTRATIQELREGLQATSQNRWPSLGFDVGAVNDRLGSLFSAGFYYKTFMWPRAFWDRVYEPVIRAAAGLGVAPREPDADRYASRFAHVDVLVVGAGPAGIAAALAAGRSGASVMLVEETAEPGGALLSQPSLVIDGLPAWEWLAKALAELGQLANVAVMTRTTAIGYYHQNLVALAQRLTDHLTAPPPDAPRERLWKVRAREVVLAQGALEKPLVFDGNDRPGVMLAGAAQTYLERYGVRVGDRPAIVTAHDSAWHTAFDLAKAGARPAIIVDVRPSVDPALAEGARALGIATLVGGTVTATAGHLRVTSLRVGRVEDGKPGRTRDVACDAVLMCGGWTPCLHLFSHTRGSLAWDDALKAFVPGNRTEALRGGVDRGR